MNRTTPGRRRTAPPTRRHRSDHVVGAAIVAGSSRSAPRSARRRGRRTDRTAVLSCVSSVQQRLTRRTDCWRRGSACRRSRRRALLDTVIRDVCDGAHSLGELDFARMCRRAGLPPPTRQAVRTGPGGRVYLDVAWEDIGLVVEIDGGHHALALNPVDDALRQNEVTLSADLVLRIPVLGLRLTSGALHGPGRARPPTSRAPVTECDAQCAAQRAPCIATAGLRRGSGCR